MINLYHKEKRNHRQAIQGAAYMVNGDGFVELPETEEGAKHALYLVDHCGFMFPKGECPPWVDPGPPVPERTPLVSAEEVRASSEAGTLVIDIEPDIEPEPEPPNDPPTEEGYPDVADPESDTSPEAPEPAEEPLKEPEVTTDLSRDDLRAMASTAGVSGFKTMSKVDLVKAINEAAKAR